MADEKELLLVDACERTRRSAKRNIPLGSCSLTYYSTRSLQKEGLNDASSLVVAEILALA